MVGRSPGGRGREGDELEREQSPQERPDGRERAQEPRRHREGPTGPRQPQNGQGPPQPGAPGQREVPTGPRQEREVPPDGGAPSAGIRDIEMFERHTVAGYGSVDDPLRGRGPVTSARPPPRIDEFERDMVGNGRGVSRAEDEVLRYL